MLSYPPPGKNDRLNEILAALPRVSESTQLLSKKTALAAFFHLTDMHSHLSERVSAHTDPLVQEAVELIEAIPGQEETYALTETELRGLISGAAIVGAMEAAYGIGEALLDVREIQEIFARASATSGECGGGEGQPPAA
ncbi:MAG: hypothetical protein JWP13_563 [Candidatus Saccharibacteria bacterium]|nr:hypothetical protein [Candidatus Saccharibacteria bacterium]